MSRQERAVRGRVGRRQARVERGEGQLVQQARLRGHEHAGRSAFAPHELSASLTGHSLGPELGEAEGCGVPSSFAQYRSRRLIWVSSNLSRARSPQHSAGSSCPASRLVAPSAAAAPRPISTSSPGASHQAGPGQRIGRSPHQRRMPAIAALRRTAPINALIEI